MLLLLDIIFYAQWRIQDLQTGAKVERRRREYRGAEGAERVWFGEGGISLPNGEGSGERALPLPRKFFDFESENGDF